MTLGNDIGIGTNITSKGETMKHYIAKCIAHKIAIDKGHKSKIEFNIDTAIVDVAVLYDDQWWAYEIQKNTNEKVLKEKTEAILKNSQFEEVKIIDLKLLSNITSIMIRQLNEMII